MTARCWSVLFFFLLVLPNLAAVQDNPMELGLELFRQGNFQDAVLQFQRAAAMQPDNPQIENLLGIGETRLDHIQQANLHYKNAIRLQPSFEAPYKNLGFNHLNAHEYALAKAELEKALVLDSSDSFAHYYLAVVLLKTSKDTEAIVHLKPAESLIENDPDAAFLMALACLRANRVDQSLAIIDAVQQHSAFSLEQEFHLAAALNSKGMYPESLRIFEQMQKQQPGSWIATYDLSVALVEADKSAEALPLLEPLATNRPNDGRILSLLGSVYESQNKLPEALNAYQRAVAAEPANSGNYLDYTRLLMDLDRYDDAVALIRKGIQNVHDTWALSIRLGAINLMKGNTEEAVESFRKAIQERPDVAIGYVALAKAYMKEGKDQEAGAELADARRKVGKDFALEYVYGLVCEQLGKTNNALDALTNAENLNPSVVEPHYQLGKLYMEQERWPQAQTEFVRVLTLDPTHAQARYQLSRIYARIGDAQKAREMQEEARRLMDAERETALNAQRARLTAFNPQ